MTEQEKQILREKRLIAGNRLKELLVLRGVSQTELVNELQLMGDNKTIQKINDCIHGARPIQYRTALNIAKILNIDEKYLIDEKTYYGDYYSYSEYELSKVGDAMFESDFYSKYRHILNIFGYRLCINKDNYTLIGNTFTETKSLTEDNVESLFIKICESVNTTIYAYLKEGDFMNE